jgi:hypothetical protein
VLVMGNHGIMVIGRDLQPPLLLRARRRDLHQGAVDRASAAHPFRPDRREDRPRNRVLPRHGRPPPRRDQGDPRRGRLGPRRLSATAPTRHNLSPPPGGRRVGEGARPPVRLPVKISCDPCLPRRLPPSSGPTTKTLRIPPDVHPRPPLHLPH